jgi:hypothetical protein
LSTSSIAILLGAYDQTGGVGFLFAIPEIIFEVGITIYTLWKGFRPSPILREPWTGRDVGAVEPATA